MIETIFQILVFVASLPVGLALVCRLNLMEYRTTKLPVILFHVGLIGGVASAARYAWEGSAGLASFGFVLSAGSWLVMSWETWREGKVPEHHTKPTPLDDAALRKVHGGTK